MVDKRVPKRWTAVMLLCAFVIAGLVNLFGQRPGTSTASVGAASLKIYAPARVRGGLYFEARYSIQSRADLKHATLVLDAGWIEGMTIKTIEPSPVGEASSNGKLALELGHVPTGRLYRLFIRYHVDPTNLGHRRQAVALYDGDTFLTSVSRSVTVRKS